MSILLCPKNRQNLGMIVTSFSDFFLTPVSTASTFSSYFVSFAQRPPHIQGPNPESHRSPRYHFRIPLELSFCCPAFTFSSCFFSSLWTEICFQSCFYSKTPQSADLGTVQSCTADCEIRRLRVLLYVVNGTKWCITQC